MLSNRNQKARLGPANTYLLVAVCCLATLAVRDAAAGDTFTGKVVAVADGDTITVLREKTPVKIRLHGVDAPEKAQPFGEQARQLTANLVFGKEVRVEVVTNDKYGRTVARVSYPGALHRNPLDPARPHEVVAVYQSLEQSLLQAGLAWWYRKYSQDKKLAQLEAEAQKAKRGLWAAATPTPPWVWRHPDLVCQKDADCVFLPSICPRCPPCAPTPRRVGNRQEQKRIARTQARVRCAQPRCPPCASTKNWVEGTAICAEGRCALKEPVRPPTPAGGISPYHGNMKSKALHAPGCRDYNCKNCTVELKSVDDAKKAGYRPHQACVARFESCYRACLKQQQARAVEWTMIELDCWRRCKQ